MSAPRNLAEARALVLLDLLVDHTSDRGDCYYWIASNAEDIAFWTEHGMSLAHRDQAVDILVARGLAHLAADERGVRIKRGQAG